ncbi:hypothetical protein OG21DRAFT_1419985 [Imleria badia]|nr:hypothetical protein OG21DRAFT_1419985 [Imleria badia]
MDETPQNIYGKCLSNNRGYPLWFPEPSTSLPLSYQQDGLQIGDVGVVDQKGSFDVLFNICHPSQHALHQRHRMILADFKFDPIALDIDVEVDVRSNADPPGRVIISSGITRVPSQSLPKTDSYEFVPTWAKGAILVLPHGATCHDLRSKEKFRTIAMERALEWYEIARNRYGENMSACSLYLITGFYKARSWSLASFNDPASLELVNPRSIKVGRQESIEGGSTTGRYWECTFPVDYRDGPGSNHNGSVNQTVYISGFKIAVREDVLRWWAQGPVVEPVPAVRRPHRFARFLKWLLFGRKRASRFRHAIRTVEHLPSLSPVSLHLACPLHLNNRVHY